MASIREIPVNEQQSAFVEDDDASSGFVTESDDGASDISDSDDLERELASWKAEDETLADRLYALRDIVSPMTRERLAATWKTSTSYAGWGAKLAGNAVWVITTSALLVGLPLALAIENETMMVQQEKEMLAQQQGAQQMMGGAPAGEQKSDGLRPPGF